MARSGRPIVVAYIEDPSETGADFAWKVGAFALVATWLPLATLVLPRSEPIRWPWMLVALALISANATGAVVLAVRTRRSERFDPPSIAVASGLNMSALASVVAFDLALGAGSGYLRVLILLPVLIMATIGDRTQFALSFAAGVVAFGVTVLPADLQAPDAVPHLTVELIAGVAIALFVRMFATASVGESRKGATYAAMSDVSATAATLDEGLDRMLPLVGEYLGATEVAVCSVNDRGEVAVVAAHPDPDATGAAVRLLPTTLERAHQRGAPVVGDGCCLIPVATTNGMPLVAVASGTTTAEHLRLALEQRCRKVSLQLAVLVWRMEMIERLEVLTRTDGLTGIPNRRALMERLDHELRVARRTGEPITAVMVDLDHFKSFNDTFGHLAGDDALVAVSSLLHNRLRATDLVARYGGEELCVVLTRTNVAVGRMIMDELRRLTANLEGPQQLTFSAGLAEWDGRESPEALLARADEALYHAKAAGRDQCRVFGEQQRVQRLAPHSIPPDSVSLN